MSVSDICPIEFSSQTFVQPKKPRGQMSAMGLKADVCPRTRTLVQWSRRGAHVFTPLEVFPIRKSKNSSRPFVRQEPRRTGPFSRSWLSCITFRREIGEDRAGKWFPDTQLLSGQTIAAFGRKKSDGIFPAGLTNVWWLNSRELDLATDLDTKSHARIIYAINNWRMSEQARRRRRRHWPLCRHWWIYLDE